VSPTSGCGIYADRPTECRQFYCEYLLDGAAGEHWKPSRCKMVVVMEDYANELVIHTDPARPHAWRREPYYSGHPPLGPGRGRQRGWGGGVEEDDCKLVIAPDRPALGEMGQLGL
jgi:hypothetical protein